MKDTAASIGNSCIGGAIAIASSIGTKNDVNIDYLEAITSNAKEDNLSLHNEFQNKYMTCMCIEREE